MWPLELELMVRGLWRLEIAGMAACLAIGGGVSAVAQEPDFGFIPGFEHALKLREDPMASGMAYFPARFTDGRPTRILDPAGFDLIMTDAEVPGEEIRFPAGKLFEPPRGRYRLWIEGDWEITPFTQLTSFGRKRPPGSKSFQALPVVPAGRVTLSGGWEDPHLQLRVLYAEDRRAEGLRWELSRHAQLGVLDDGIIMPHGRNLAAVWDPARVRYVGLSRPFELPAGKVVAAPVQQPPNDLSFLLVFLERPPVGYDPPDLTVRLTIGERELPPDAEVPNAWGVYGFWYDLAPGDATLNAGSDRLYLDPMPIHLERGRITRVQAHLKQRPFQDD